MLNIARTIGTLSLITLTALACKSSGEPSPAPAPAAEASQTASQTIAPAAPNAPAARPHAGVFIMPTTIEVNGEDGELVEQAAEDCLAVVFKSDEEIFFDLKLSFNHEHSCRVDGTATRVGGAGPYVYREVADDLDCTIHLSMEEDAVRVVDVGEGCQSYYCGARAGSLEATVPLTSKVDYKKSASCSSANEQ